MITDRPGRVFPNEVGIAEVIDLRPTWKRVRKRAGLNGVRLHDLRHTYASLLINNGATLAVVGACLGHSAIQTTMRYCHVSTETTAIAGADVAALIKGPAA